MEIDLNLLKAHPNQQKILRECKRYNVLKCGRRFGKTSLCEELITDVLVDFYPVAYYAPTYKALYDVWGTFKEILEPIIIEKNETVKQLKTMGGGVLDMWSLEDPDSGRGRKYKRVIVDEAEMARHLEKAWTRTIRATLADYKGDAWFLSTPKFGSTYFKKLSAMNGPNWASWIFTTYDNPYIDREEIDEARDMLDESTFRCEFLAEDVSLAVNKFIYSFDAKKHIIPGLQGWPDLPICLAFDFNVDPITCLVAQHDGLEEVRILREYRLMTSDIYELCARIKSDYGDRMLLVTGDASGQNRTALKRDLDYYRVIKSELDLQMGQFKVPGFNPPVRNTRILCNSLLARHPKYFFSDKVPFLILDIEETEVDATGSIDKTKDKHQSHLLDCWRYFNYSYIRHFLNARIYDPEERNDGNVPTSGTG